MADICSTTAAHSSDSSADAKTSLSSISGTARMPSAFHSDIQCIEHRVNSAGFDSVRPGHSGSDGSMLSAMCSPALTRAVKKSNGLITVPSASIRSFSGPKIWSSSSWVNSPGTSPLDNSELTVSKIAGVTSWWSSMKRRVSLFSTATSARIRFRSTLNARSS